MSFGVAERSLLWWLVLEVHSREATAMREEATALERASRWEAHRRWCVLSCRCWRETPTPQVTATPEQQGENSVPQSRNQFRLESKPFVIRLISLT